MTRRSPSAARSAARLARLASRSIIVALSTTATLMACGGGGDRHASRSAAIEARSGRVAPDSAADAGSPDAAPASGADAELHAANELRRVGDALAHGTSTARTIGGSPTFHLVEARRISSGVPEVHERWIDVTIVQAGHVTLLAGGHVDGGTRESDGERRGGTITGGTARPLASGDLVVVPAGVPHQFQLAAGDSIRYLTIKVPRAAASP